MIVPLDGCRRLPPFLSLGESVGWPAGASSDGAKGRPPL